MNLKDKKCIPHKSYVPELSEQEKIVLMKEISDWNFNQDKTRIIKDFNFKNFKQSLHFLNQVAQLAETENHHPDFHLSWGKCKIEIWTHVNNNLNENDFILAAKIDELITDQSQHQV
jgi:4a-hydroxytetrahydrobiopterin dehydratase